MLLPALEVVGFGGASFSVGDTFVSGRCFCSWVFQGPHDRSLGGVVGDFGVAAFVAAPASWLPRVAGAATLAAAVGVTTLSAGVPTSVDELFA